MSLAPSQYPENPMINCALCRNLILWATHDRALLSLTRRVRTRQTTLTSSRSRQLATLQKISLSL